MSEQVTHTVILPPLPLTKFERERTACLRLLPELPATHQGRFVAIHEERVVCEGDNVLEVANEAYRQVGHVPIYLS